jgi:large-conductance mechanosensitive channel
VKDIFTGVLGLFVKCEAILDGTGKKIGENCSGLAGKKYKSVEWGNFVNNVINFVLIAFVVFMLVKAYKKASGRALAQDGPSDNDLLKEIRDSLKNR